MDGLANLTWNILSITMLLKCYRLRTIIRVNVGTIWPKKCPKVETTGRQREFFTPVTSKLRLVGKLLRSVEWTYAVLIPSTMIS